MANDLAAEPFQETILELVKRVEKLLLRQATEPRQRILIGLAGVPGSGKSTVSNALLAELDARNIKNVAVVPMVRGDRISLHAVTDSIPRTGSITPSRLCRPSKMLITRSEDVVHRSRLTRQRSCSL